MLPVNRYLAYRVRVAVGTFVKCNGSDDKQQILLLQNIFYDSSAFLIIKHNKGRALLTVGYTIFGNKSYSSRYLFNKTEIHHHFIFHFITMLIYISTDLLLC
jgi:hypothetical protein